jgi:hypothetical protein
MRREFHAKCVKFVTAERGDIAISGENSRGMMCANGEARENPRVAERAVQKAKRCAAVPST